MTLTRPLLTLALLSSLTACTSAPESGLKITMDLTMSGSKFCFQPIGGNEIAKVDDWMCHNQVSGEELGIKTKLLVSATTTKEGDPADVSLGELTQLAQLDAIPILGQFIRVKIANTWKRHGVLAGDARQPDYKGNFVENTIDLLVNVAISGVLTLRSAALPINGGDTIRVYVLMGIDADLAHKALEAKAEQILTSSSMKHDWQQLGEEFREAQINATQGIERARWQEFNAKEALAELMRRTREEVLAPR